MGGARITAMMRSVIGMSVVQQRSASSAVNRRGGWRSSRRNLTPTYPPALAVTLEQPAPAVRFSYAPVEAGDTGADDRRQEGGW